jgi:hypothetical protein
VRDSQANWVMLESSLLIEEMVGATTPALVILISNLPQRENCKLPGLMQNSVIFGCQQTAKRYKPLQLRPSKMVNFNLIQGAGLVILAICCVTME